MLKYISSVEEKKEVLILQDRMADYYAQNDIYYDDINFAVSNWVKKEQLGYQKIIQLARGGKVAEVGCGRASILDLPNLGITEYTGCDFSESLMRENSKRYPLSHFRAIESPQTLPLDSGAYDLIFCVFVLEHVVQPELFLRELVRCCRKGGRVVILCPDFAGRSGISSQVVGFSNGSGMEKIKKGHLLDGLITGYVNKLLMPAYFKIKLRNADKRPVFLLNNNPACFCRNFYPDADAVYVTHRGEIVHVLEELGCEHAENDDLMKDYLMRGRNMFIEAIKDR